MNGRAPLPASSVESLYEEYYALLRFLAAQRFQIPDDEINGLITEIFITFLERRTTVYEPKAWLVGAICHASRHYWRKHGKTDQLPVDYEQAVDQQDASDRVDAMALLARQSARCQELLKLRYLEGYSVAELAERLGTTPGYVKKLLHQCTMCARKS
ncbi:MAG TPA: sigma-70 family RNA polymerase sigma factor [Thermoanaerobaculia bacterium]|nr:sigma-70 family RNA polymerase sigma factor [Thermoanaerobaculia bacterium]